MSSSCFFHFDRKRAAFCMNCGTSLCEECVKRIGARTLCLACTSKTPSSSPPQAMLIADPTASPQQSALAEAPPSRLLAWLIVLFYSIAAIDGIRSGAMMGLMPGGSGNHIYSPYNAIYFLAYAITLTWICIEYSSKHGRPLRISTYWFVFFTLPFSVPVCVYRARGWPGIGYLAAHVLALSIVLFVSAMSAYFVVFIFTFAA